MHCLSELVYCLLLDKNMMSKFDFLATYFAACSVGRWRFVVPRSGPIQPEANEPEANGRMQKHGTARTKLLVLGFLNNILHYCAIN